MAQTTDLKFDVKTLLLYVIVMKRSSLLSIQPLVQQNAGELNAEENECVRIKKAPKIVEALDVFTTE